MTLDPDACYEAATARDARFDGRFFVAVRTTGVYCRPICPARTPGRDRVVFFARAAQAERAGFRACLRCRPELAPGAGPAEGLPRLVARAVARIEAGALDGRSVDELAAALGVTGPGLRRAMRAELGVGPQDLARTRRLALAKALLHDTALPLAEVAAAAGFRSPRALEAAFRARFGRPASALRRAAGEAGASAALVVRLDYRPPLDWEALLAFLAARSTAGVEAVEDGAWRRTVRIGSHAGWVSVRPDPRRPALRAEIAPGLAPALGRLVAGLRALFDLDARPDAVAAHLRRDPLLGPSLRRRPGLRVAGALDGFDAAVRVVVGQQVSVAAATTIAGRLARALGDPVETPFPGLDRLPATPRALAAAGEDRLAGLGMPGARARTLGALAAEVAAGRLRLERGADLEAVRAALLALPGVGPWTVEVVAMRALGAPDAFPAGDLGVWRALGVSGARAAEARAEGWRPWRAYATAHLWASLADGRAGGARGRPGGDATATATGLRIPSRRGDASDARDADAG